MLIVVVMSKVRLKNSKFKSVTLEPGTYIYLGSGGGPGGVLKRVYRHILLSLGVKEAKRPRWHIDWLLTEREVIAPGALIVTGRWGIVEEEKIADLLVDSKIVLPTVKEFGCTDSRSVTHLFKLVGGVDRLVEAVGLPCVFLHIDSIEGPYHLHSAS